MSKEPDTDTYRMLLRLRHMIQNDGKTLTDQRDVENYCTLVISEYEYEHKEENDE